LADDFGIYLAVVILIAGAVLAKVAERFKIPYPIPLMVAGLGIKLVIDPAIFAAIPLSLIAQLTLASVLFYAGLNINIRELTRSIRSIAALATVGVFLTSLIAGGTIWIALPAQVGLGAAFIIGAILSPTDPAALFSVLESGGVRVKRKLFSILEGEAVFNDATAVIIVITIFLPFIVPELAQPWWIVIGQFIASMALGVMLGLGIAWGMSKTLLSIEGSTNTAIVTAATPIIAYGVGELFAVFGIHPGALNSRMIGFPILPQKSMRGIMKNVSFVFEIIVFMFLGINLDLAAMTPEIITVGGIVALLVILIARPVSVFIVTAFDKTMNKRDRFFISWAGVKGVASAALAAIVVVEIEVGLGGAITSIVFIVVFISLVVQGISAPRIATILDLIEEQDAAQEVAAMRDATRHALLSLVDKYTEGKVSSQIYSRLKAELEEEIFTLEDDLRKLVSDKRARLRELEIREEIFREKLAFFEAEYEKGKVPETLFEDQKRELQAEIDDLSIQRRPQLEDKEKEKEKEE